MDKKMNTKIQKYWKFRQLYKDNSWTISSDKFEFWVSTKLYCFNTSHKLRKLGVFVNWQEKKKRLIHFERHPLSTINTIQASLNKYPVTKLSFSYRLSQLINYYLHEMLFKSTTISFDI